MSCAILRLLFAHIISHAVSMRFSLLCLCRLEPKTFLCDGILDLYLDFLRNEDDLDLVLNTFFVTKGLSLDFTIASSASSASSPPASSGLQALYRWYRKRAGNDNDRTLDRYPFLFALV